LNSKNIKQASKISIDELLKSLDTTYQGLNLNQVQHRIKQYGYNTISADKKQSAALKLLSGFLNPLILMLFSIVLISLIIKEMESAYIIMAMIIVNVFMTFLQEYQADKATEKLKKLVCTTVIVIRAGKETEILQTDLVVGDIIKLSAGHIIPADIRIISSKNLYVN